MSALTAEIEKRNAAAAQRRDSHAATVAARAPLSRTAAPAASMPCRWALPRAARGALPQVRDTTDYNAAARRAWVKDIARRSGVQLIEGTDFTQVERDAYNALVERRTAFTHLTSNTDAVIPVELQTQIFTLIDNTAVLYGDIHKDNFPHQFELIRHKSIKAGDAAKTDEGAAPADEEQNEFDPITLTGEEIKKTVKMSRKMAVQSINGFEQYIVNETGARLAVAANARVHAKTVDGTLGMDSGNKINCATAGTLAKADITKLLGLLYTYGNPAPKGCIIYANGNTIWNPLLWSRMPTGALTSWTRRPKTPPLRVISSASSLSATILWQMASSRLVIPTCSVETSSTAWTLRPMSSLVRRSAALTATCSLTAALSCLRLSDSSPSAPPQSNEVVTDGREAEAA